MKGKQAGLVAMLLVTVSFTSACAGNNKMESIKTGMEAVSAMQYEEALASFDAAILNGEDKEQAYRGQGLAYMGLTQYEEARTSLLNALSFHKGGPDEMVYDINYYLAVADYKNGDLEKAIATYSSILALKDSESQAYYLRGCAYLETENYEKAISDYEKAMQLSPTDYSLFIDIYTHLEKHGYEEAGIGYLKKLLEEQSDKMSLYDKGRISYYCKDYESARNNLEEARLDSKDVTIIIMLGKTYEALGDSNYAASIYAGYLKETENAVIYNRLGVCRLELEDYQSALEAFQAGIKLNDTTMMQTLSYNEIVAYEYLQQYNQAIVSMEAYLKKYPDDEKALREYEFLKTR